jgi:hypothetical protein
MSLYRTSNTLKDPRLDQISYRKPAEVGYLSLAVSGGGCRVQCQCGQVSLMATEKAGCLILSTGMMGATVIPQGIILDPNT